MSDSRHRPATSKTRCELLRPRGRRTLDWIEGKPRLGTYETLLASLATRHPHLDYGSSYRAPCARRRAILSSLPGRMQAAEFPSPCDGSESALRSVFGRLDKENRAPSKACNLYRQELFPTTGPLEVRITEASATHSMNHTRPRGGQCNGPFHKSQRAGGITARALEIQGQNPCPHIDAPSDSIPRLFTLGECL